MNISSESHDNCTLLRLEGRLDLNSSSKLKEQVKELVSEGSTNVVLELGGVGFVNSSGLGTLVSILKDVRIVKGQMVLCNLAQYVQEIFEITQLSHIFDIYATETEAMESMNATPAQVGQDY